MPILLADAIEEAAARMTNAPKPTVVSPLDSKMQSLAAFIESHLPQSRNDAVNELTLLARSYESPIAQAVVQHAGVIAERGIKVRALFAIATAQGDAGAWTSLDAGLEFEREVRWSRNPRYFDAHEQIVLSTASCWIGDCMRRDPAKRDALDLPKPNCPEAALFASRSFDHLWRRGQPLSLRAGRGKSDALFAEMATTNFAIAEVPSAEIDSNQ
jgi:hypothetical protein